jgi:heat shock protein HslJ
MKKTYSVLVLLVLVALALAACGAPPAPAAPTAAPEQATPAAPATQPTEAAQPPAAQPPATSGSAQQLIGKVWQWTKTTYNDDRTIDVPTPASYTIEFMADGTAAIKADCNNVLGTYMADASNMTITLGPSTLAMCPPGSLDTEYLKELGEVAQYLVQGETLTLNFKMDSGGMTFVPATAAAAQPAQPGGPQAMPGQDLGGKTWQWVTTKLNDGQTMTPSNPADYTIEFSMVDGRVNIKADCNNATGEFMTDGQSLQIMIGGITRAMCPPGSLSEEFLKELSEVNSYTVQGDTLTMQTANGPMTLSGAPQGAAQPPAQPAQPAQPQPAASLEGPTWNWIKTEYSNDTTITAPDPAKYTLKFSQTTRRFVFIADCNNGSGVYTLDGQNLSMQVQGMTRAYCPPPSDEYVKMLGEVASYKIEGSTLYLAFKMDGGIMTFTTGGAQPAPGAGSGATTPSQPAGSNKQRLTSGVWKWQQSADNSGRTWTSPNPANYTLQFNPAGTVVAQLDCNQSNGVYQADETNLTITLGPTTLMACPPPTLDSVFAQQLSQVSSYFFDGNDLILLWKADSGSMKFSQ